jgi:hypothetical protein
MRMRALITTIVLAACTHAAVDAPPSSPPALGTCADAIVEAKRKSDMGWQEDPRPLDADGDGTPECVLRGCYSSNCELVIYRRERGAVRRIGEMTASFVSGPHCVDKPPAGTFCRLEVGVHMIHGEIQQSFWRYDGKHYVEDGYGELRDGR